MFPDPNRLTENQFRLLALLPLLFFVAQGIHYWRSNELGHMLWACNIGNLLLAIGLFLNHAALIRIIALWTVPGFMVWFVYVVVPWGVFLSSTLAHLGGIVVAMIAVRRIGMDRDSWIYSFAAYLLVQLSSRFLTPATLNVNLSHSVHDGWHTTFDSYWKFWIVATILSALILWAVGLLLRRLWPAETEMELTPAVR